LEKPFSKIFLAGIFYLPICEICQHYDEGYLFSRESPQYCFGTAAATAVIYSLERRQSSLFPLGFFSTFTFSLIRVNEKYTTISARFLTNASAFRSRLL